MAVSAGTGAVSYATESLVVDVGGAPLADELSDRLLSVSVDDSVSVPGGFTLVFRDPFHDVIARGRFALGATLSISLADGRKLLSGAEITARECEVDPLGTVTLVRGFDLSHRLHRGRRTEVYRQVRYSDVARKVAQRTGLSGGRIDTPRMAVRPQVMQWNTSDWDFLTRLAREVGFEVAVVDGKLTFAARTAASGGPAAASRDPVEPRQLTLANVVRFRCVVSGAEQVAQVEVRGWSTQLKKEVVGTARVASRGSVLGESPAAAASKLKGQTLTSVAKLYDQVGDAGAAATALAEEVGAAYATFEGLAHGNPDLRAGRPVSLGLAGAGFDGKYTLTATRHTFDEDGYTTWFACGATGDHSLLGIAGAGGSRDERIEGVVPAIVTDVRDPSKLGRVKLSFPWLSSSNESFWARVAQPWVGRGYGALFVPEVNDEVLVAFEQGDFARPYVVGGLYNGQDPPKTGSAPLVDPSSGRINVRRMETRQHHAVELVDKLGAEGVFVKTGDGKLALDLDVASTRISVTSKGEVKIEGTRAVTISSPTGDVSIKGNKVTVQGNEVAVDARAALALKGGLVTTLEGKLVKIN